MSELVQIYASGDAMTAELTRARLEDEGIDVLVKNSMGGSSVYPVGPSYLFVPVEQEIAAGDFVSLQHGAILPRRRPAIVLTESSAPPKMVAFPAGRPR